HLNGIQIVSNLGIVPPQNLSAFDISSNKAHLSWESAGAGSAVDGYKVYRDEVNIADVTAAEYVDYCLSPDTQYSYQVSAYNSEDESDLSPSLAVETMSFGDLAGDGAVDTNDLRVLLFNWLESGMCIQGDLNNDSIVNLVDYSELLSHWTYPDITAPSVPQNLSVSDVTSASVSLTWQSSADDTAVAGYYVYRDGAKVSSSGDNVQTDAPLNAQTSYSYQIAAYDEAGNVSDLSDPVDVTTTNETYSVAGVPHKELDFSKEVKTWWSELSYNPDSVNYDPTIPSPEFVLNAGDFDGSIQDAIDALPEEGGTVFVPNGVYTENFGIIARDNVHIVGESKEGVIIRAPAWDPNQSNEYHSDDHHMIKVAGHESAILYPVFDYHSSLNKGDFREEEWNALVNKKRNIAFRNLTFDGHGTVNGAIDFAAVMDILVENCEFKNFTHSVGYHEPAITGHAHIDNIIVRNCTFREAIDTPLQFYMDGVHGCYMINNVFEGKLLFLCNDDFTEDLNENGVTDEYEERESKYVVIYDNEFVKDTWDPMSFTGSNLLFKKNHLPINIVTIATCTTRYSHQAPDLVYEFFNLNFLENDIKSVGTTLVRLNNNSNPAPEEYSDPLMGYINIEDNYVGSNPTDDAYLIVEPPVMESTITVNGNMYGQPWPPVEPDTQAPTAPSGLSVTNVSSSSAALSWSASTDNIAVEGYKVYRDGVYIDSTSSTSYIDSSLNPETAYSYSVSAFDAADNDSNLSNSVNAQTESADTQKPRVVVMTDFGRLTSEGDAWIGDPDDYQSMTRLLLYSNMIDLQGLICVTSTSVKYDLYPDELKTHIDAYGQVRDNLLLHESGFPTAGYLKSIVKSGNVDSSVYGMDAVGSGKSSEGSDWIISLVDSDDPRPLYILAWGGTNTLAQALWDVQANRSQAELNEFLSKIRVYPIAKQDGSYNWLVSNFVQAGDPDKQLFWIDGAAGAWKGISAGPSTIFDVQGGDESLVSHQWIDDNIRNKGALGVPQRYPYHTYIMEGDTPSFMYMLPVGIGDPERPELGGWGGRYSSDGPLHTAEIDTVNGISEIYASVWRWRQAYQNDFSARMDWCVESYNLANHPPEVEVEAALERTVNQGDLVAFDAQNSYDPDSDNLNYQWYRYSEADTYSGSINISNPDTATASFTAPGVSSTETINIILAVTDNGSPNLTRYKQFVITVNP
ncbi:nucleoside hydrolase-like domain-containing protein, partial [Sedimentisphaera salicampi]|uniref:nucleoside hydrolase-like domain-containing protein n=1 Tax=Sedimentisphaera salicampi TaxID=1941349 RepID=UPI00137A8579